MCRHTAVTRTPLPATAAAPRLARQALRQAACRQHAAHLLVPAELVVSELVTNAVRHGEAPISLDVDCVFGQGMVLAVSDAGHALPQARQAATDASGGRGVHLIDFVATRWGVTQHHGATKKVWVVLDPEHFGADGTRIQPAAREPQTHI